MLDIGELGRRVRMRPSALRYYERVGLLPPAEKVGGRRVYPASTVRRIALIRMTQRAGFTLAEIRELLDGGDRAGARPAGVTPQWRAFAERKLPELDQRIEELRALRAGVADCLECGCMSFESCQLLAVPTGDEG